MGSHDRATLMIADPARIPATAPLAELACATTTPTGPEADHATGEHQQVRRTAGRILSGGVRRGLRSVHPADRQPDPDRERHRRGGPPRASGAYVPEPTNPARIATTTPAPTMTSRRRPEPVGRHL